MPSALISYEGFPDTTSTHSIDFATDENPNKYYIYIENKRAKITTSKSSEQGLHAASLHAKAWSMDFFPIVPLYLRTDRWCPSADEPLGLGGYDTSYESISTHLRPDDEIQIGTIRIKIVRENKPLSHVGEIQVKSSGQTVISLENEEQQSKTEEPESPIVADQPISTPNPQPSHNNNSIESVTETPAASSRHQQPPINLSPILSSIVENAIKGNEDSKSWSSDPNNREIMSQLKNIAESHARSSSLGESIELKIDEENTAQAQNETEVDENIDDPMSELLDKGPFFTIEPDKMIDDCHNDLHSKSLIHNSVSNDDTQNSTRERGDRLLKAAVGSQERLSNPPPSSPIDELFITDPGISNLTSKVLDVSSSGLETPRMVPTKKSVRNELKRKKNDDDSQGSIQSTFHVEIPISESVFKKRKTNPLTPAESSNRALAERQKSNPSTPTSAVKSKSVKFQNIESSRESIEPSSSSRSTRSSSIAIGAKIMYASSTTVDKQSKLMNFLGKQKIRKAKSVADCDFLCIGKGELKKTSNLVMAAISGKQIINDDWVVQSAAEGELLDFEKFLARDAAREAEWGISLDKAIQRGKDGIKPLAGLNFHFSPAVKKELGKGYSDLKDIAILAGATFVQATLPKKSNPDPHQSSNNIVIAAHNDRDLHALAAGGWRCYSKDILTLSVLRGGLDADSDEYLISNQKGED